MRQTTLGEQELEVLRFISDHEPATVAQVVGSFGAPRGLARTTVLTVIERLRRKQYLRRRKEGGVYQYSPTVPKADLLKSLARDFRERVLGGSIEPFVAHVAEAREVTDQEFEALEKLVQELKRDREEGTR
ncbi:MAG: BlaI/MecI/CopY family transcriptional regulator [Armatimonadia bacterium]